MVVDQMKVTLLHMTNLSLNQNVYSRICFVFSCVIVLAQALFDNC